MGDSGDPSILLPKKELLFRDLKVKAILIQKSKQIRREGKREKGGQLSDLRTWRRGRAINNCKVVRRRFWGARSFLWRS